MKSIFKWAGTLVVVTLTTITASVVYFVHTKISPDELKVFLVRTIEKNFPETKADFEKVKYSLGFNANFTIEKFSLQNKSDKRELFQAENLRIKIPIWSMIVEGGTIDLFIDNAKLVFESDKGISNWERSLSLPPESKSSFAILGVKSKEDLMAINARDIISVPTYLVNSQINIHLKDMGVSYKIEGRKKGEFLISKLLIKNFNFKTNTAFEIVSKLNLKISENQTISFDVLVIGQFNLGEYLKDGEMQTIEVIHFDNMKLVEKNILIPGIRMELNATLSKSQPLQGFYNLIAGQNSLSSRFKMEKKQLSFEAMDASFEIAEIFNIFHVSIKGLDVGESHLTLKGDLSVSQDGELHPKFTFALSRELEYKFLLGLLTLDFHGEVSSEKSMLHTKSNIQGGVIDTSTVAVFNLKKLLNLKSDDIKFDSHLFARGLKFSKIDFQKILSQIKMIKIEEQKSEPSSNNEMHKIDLKDSRKIIPFVKLSLDSKDVMIDGKTVRIHGKLASAPGHLKLGGLNIDTQDGSLNASAEVFFKQQEKEHAIFKVLLRSFDGEILSIFLAGLNKISSGKISGEVNGNLEFDHAIQYVAKVDINAENGRVGENYIGNYFKEVKLGVPSLRHAFEHFDSNSSQDFSYLGLKCKITQSEILIKKIEMHGANENFKLTGKGRLFPESMQKEGALIFDYVGSKVKTDNNIDLKSLKNPFPLRAKGYGLKLVPDIAFIEQKLVRTKAAKQND